MLGKTVVNIEVKQLKSQPLPATTVCIQTIVSISNLKELYEFAEQLIHKYMNIINGSLTNDQFTEEMKQNLKYIYKNITKNILIIVQKS